MLQFQQLKTGGNVIIPLNSVAKRLIQKYVEFYQLEGGLIFPKATLLRYKNVSLEDVSELLGHSSIKMTKLYAKSSMKRLVLERLWIVLVMIPGWEETERKALTILT